jgi:ATP-dependent Clp protease ATP-binding subunit ClpA
MYERFTDRARKVMQLANQEAQQFNHEYIGTEHILLGLVEEGSGTAATALKNLDVDLGTIRAEVEKIVQHGPARVIDGGRRPHTPRAKKVVEYSIEEARSLNHNYVGTEHLLLGLIREDQGVASQVLMSLGLSLERVRRAIVTLLDQTLPDAAERTVRLPAVPVPGRQELTGEQFEAAQNLLKRLLKQRERLVAQQDFERAARRRAEAESLTCLLAWYVRTLGR